MLSQTNSSAPFIFKEPTLRKSFILAAVAALTLTACTDAQTAKFGGLGNPARITCYSGGKVVFDDFSTGKVSPEDGGAGYYFRSATTHKLVEMTGDCRVIYDEQKPANFTPVL